MGASEKFKTEIGVGECAGVKIDLAKTLLFESNEKLEEAEYFFLNQKYVDAAYSVYSSIIQSAKCYLLKRGIETNSKEQIQQEFEKHFVKVSAYFVQPDFESLIYEYRNASDTSVAISDWIQTGKRFYKIINTLIDKNENE